MDKAAFLKRLPAHFDPEVVCAAPGRANLIGEHTDYNGGLCLTTIVPYQTFFALRKNGTKDALSFTELAKGETYMGRVGDTPGNGNTWAAYLMGVVQAFVAKNGGVEGFDAYFEGDVPLGAGMGASASLCCGLAQGINALFGSGFAKMELAKAAQWAEHHYVGTQCGLMDQVSSLFGMGNTILLMDFKHLTIKRFPFLFDAYELFLINTNVRHALADSAYNQRRRECEKGYSILKKAYPAIECLSDVSLEMLDQSKQAMSDTIYARCKYVLEENQRVREAVRHIPSNDGVGFGKLLYASHEGLRNGYEVSCAQLDFLVDAAQNNGDILGSRMMGGGFGGCTLNLAKKGRADVFFEGISADYFAKFNSSPSYYKI